LTGSDPATKVDGAVDGRRRIASWSRVIVAPTLEALDTTAAELQGSAG
jgi:hypothetical protein